MKELLMPYPKGSRFYWDYDQLKCTLDGEYVDYFNSNYKGKILHPFIINTNRWCCGVKDLGNISAFTLAKLSFQFIKANKPTALREFRCEVILPLECSSNLEEHLALKKYRELVPFVEYAGFKKDGDLFFNPNTSHQLQRFGITF